MLEVAAPRAPREHSSTGVAPSEPLQTYAKGSRSRTSTRVGVRNGGLETLQVLSCRRLLPVVCDATQDALTRTRKLSAKANAPPQPPVML